MDQFTKLVAVMTGVGVPTGVLAYYICWEVFSVPVLSWTIKIATTIFIISVYVLGIIFLANEVRYRHKKHERELGKHPRYPGEIPTYSDSSHYYIDSSL